MMVTGAPACADEVQRRPIVVREGVPDRVAIVQRDRELDPHRYEHLRHIVDVVLERELGRMCPITTSPSSAYRSAHTRT
jgi:hypothetical protein